MPRTLMDFLPATVLIGILATTGGCGGADTPSLSAAHHLAEAHTLATMCRDVAKPQAGGSGTLPGATPADAVTSAKLNAMLAERAVERQCGTQPSTAAAIATASIPTRVAPVAASHADVPTTTAVSSAPAVSSQHASRRLLHVRFAPSSIALPERDREALKAALAKPIDTPSRQVRVAMSRGGVGNAFDQLMVANNRIAEINGLLGASVLARTTFDPTLPDDVARIEID